MSVRERAIGRILNREASLDLGERLRLAVSRNKDAAAGAIVDGAVDKVAAYEEMVDSSLGGAFGRTEEEITVDLFLRHE